MAFSSFQNELSGIQSGMIGSDKTELLSFTDFEDGIFAGRFAKFDNSKPEMFDSSATPIVAGLVFRSQAEVLASGDVTYTKGEDKQFIELIYKGFAFVQLSGEAGKVANVTPFSAVYIENTNATHYGKAIDVVNKGVGDVDANAQFIRAVSDDVWLIYIK